MTPTTDASPAYDVRVLLVDDHLPNLLALEAILGDLGYALARASSGEEALRLVAGQDFAVVLLDVQMEGMDGFEAARRVRSLERSRRTPIIFLTGYDDDRLTVERAYGLGAVDFLVKPLSPVILRAKVAGFAELFLEKGRAARLAGERAAREEAEAAGRRKDAFLAMLAHELRNPLAPILTMLEVLRAAGADGAVRRDAVERIGRQARHLNRLVDDLLEASRVAHGKVSLRTERLDLGRLARQAAEDRRAVLEAGGLALAVEGPQTPVWVSGDPTRLAQILHNLLDNAVRFCTSGRRVEVRVAADAARGEAVLSVSDDCVGIAPDVLPRLFRPFEQEDQGLDRRRGGLGLGLSVVRGLAELHGGTAEASTPGPGLGATFTVRLPLAGELPALSGMPDSVARAAARSRVLIVEDNPDAADSLNLLLTLLGHEVRIARSGPEGVQAAADFAPDVVLCDIGLPGFDGFEVARRVRRLPGLASALLIALSGYAGEEDRRRGKEAGFDHHLAKPADPAEVQRVLAARTA